MMGVLLLLAVPTSASDMRNDAPTESALIASAEAAYREGFEVRNDVAKARPRFRASADAWERLWKMGLKNTAIARNMAQSHLLAGDLANAIRAYQLGLRIAPSDRALQTGLAHARERVTFPATGNLADAARPRERKSLLHFAPVAAAWGVAAALYILAVLAGARAWMTRRGGWRMTSALLLLLAAVVAGYLRWEEWKLARENRLPLVIVAENGSVLHRGNNVEYPRRLADPLPAGVELRVITELRRLVAS